jgi:hypothetical protein
VTGYTGADVSPYLRAGRDFGRVSIFVAPAYEYEPKGRLGAVIGLEYRF